jgi:hypothetical protein
MTIATLQFDLSTEEGKEEHRAALQGSDAKLALWQFDQYLRSNIKYGDDKKRTKKELDLFQEIRSKLWEVVQEYNIVID